MGQRGRCLLLCACLVIAVAVAGQGGDDCPRIIGRAGWGARQPLAVHYLIVPVQYVIVQHTATPACSSVTACAARVAGLQAFFMDSLHYDDIGLSFLVGGDGNVYEGVGWHRVGAHTRGYNSRAVGVSLIGDFREELPPPAQLEALKKLLQCGVSLGELHPDYKLLAQRQVSATESPGMALFLELQTWPQWVEQP
ncbi:peptidoglycan-recognition protein 2-like isoform X2 [Bacillus rossius redtenbacheri]|uniref:peptidoglycan-recognition protein 2-like isoform X2 n=1 Tax=Bacillus rossius redtenbacheri TaxID=93214 RepID=UPI002FDD3D07